MTVESAILAGDVAAVRELLDAGADPQGRSPDGRTPLMIAAGLGSSPMVELLLAAGADVLTSEPRMGATALHKAAQSGATDVIGLLLDHGAIVDQQSFRIGHTPLMDAVQHRREAAVRLFLARGARTMIRNHWQQTALDLATQDGSEVIADVLRAKDEADAGRIRSLPLLAAVKAGDSAEVRRLIAAGAPLDERAPEVGDHDDDYTALGLASRDGHVEIVRLLLDAGADPRPLNGLWGATPGHEAAFGGHAGVIHELTAAGGAGSPALDLDAQGAYNGFTALHDAVWHGHLPAARALVDAGARPDLPSHTGHTARELALLFGYGDIAEFLAAAERRS